VHPVAAAIRLDDDELPRAAYLAIIVSTMNRLSLGLQPFWDRKPAPLKVTLVREHPRHLLRAIWPALHGRPHAVLTPANGYTSRNVDRFEIELAQRAVMDGEFFEAAPGGRIVLRTGPLVTFVRG